MTPIFKCIIKNGKLLIEERDRFHNYLNSLEGKLATITVEKEKRKRSLNQNAYYWSVCIGLIADYTGAEPEEVHDALKMQFTRKRFVGNLVAPASTKTLDTIGFEEYLEKVRRWAQEELNVTIPLPGEVQI